MEFKNCAMYRPTKKGCNGRVVKMLDLKSKGNSPHRFESCSQRHFRKVGGLVVRELQL